MNINKKTREIVRLKYDNKCAYTGTELLSDWQVDHIEPILRNNWTDKAMLDIIYHIDNLIPTQRIINHYKRSMGLQQFRRYMMSFHLRISKLPKNPKAPRSIKHKAYMLEVARLFDIAPNKGFNGIFYFETKTTPMKTNKEILNFIEEQHNAVYESMQISFKEKTGLNLPAEYDQALVTLYVNEEILDKEREYYDHDMGYLYGLNEVRLFIKNKK